MYFLNNSAAEKNISCDDLQFLQDNDFKVIESLSEVSGLYLFYQQGVLSLSDSEQKDILPVNVNFESKKNINRFSKNLKHTELLYKIVKGKQQITHTIDGTAGMGIDSFILSSLGLNVVAYENNPIIYLLLKDGLKRAKKSKHDFIAKISANISLKYFDVSDLSKSTDLLYLDFMFDKADKKSKSKKNMQFFKRFVHGLSIEKQNSILAEAIERKHKKIAIKRPLKTEIYSQPAYSHSIKGKSIRFDIYLPNK